MLDIGVLQTAEDGCAAAELKLVPEKFDEFWSSCALVKPGALHLIVLACSVALSLSALV